MGEKKVSLGQIDTIPESRGGTVVDLLGTFGSKGQSCDFVVVRMGQDMAGITEELLPNVGIHPQGASLALQVCLGLR